jgi:hypothetical protein
VRFSLPAIPAASIGYSLRKGLNPTLSHHFSRDIVCFSSGEK